MTDNTSDAFTALHQIKEAERKARVLIEDARKNRASQIIRDAYEEARKIKEDYLSRARQESEKKKKAIIKKASSEADKIRQASEEEIRKLSQRVESLLAKAVDKVSEQIRRHLKGRLT